jgi:hypothetical protein
MHKKGICNQSKWKDLSLKLTNYELLSPPPYRRNTLQASPKELKSWPFTHDTTTNKSPQDMLISEHTGWTTLHDYPQWYAVRSARWTLPIVSMCTAPEIRSVSRVNLLPSCGHWWCCYARQWLPSRQRARTRTHTQVMGSIPIVATNLKNKTYLPV